MITGWEYFWWSVQSRVWCIGRHVCRRRWYVSIGEC